MLKVKDFAKCKDNENRVVIQPIPTDTISLSSDDDIVEEKTPLQPKTPNASKATKTPKRANKPKTPKEPKTPKPRKQPSPRHTLTAVSRRHISKTPLTFANHKIHEYFQSTKKDCKLFDF